MKGKILKRVLAASLVLTFVSGTVPAQPIADIFCRKHQQRHNIQQPIYKVDKQHHHYRNDW